MKPEPSAPERTPQRLRQLFRHGLRHGEVNPLLLLLRPGEPVEIPKGELGAPRTLVKMAPALQPADVAALARELPALPAAVSSLIRSLDDPGVGIEQLARQIALDTALAAKTLRLANSSFYGLPRQIHSIADAAAVIGLRSVRNIALAAALGAHLRPPLELSGFWQHALAAALCTEGLALLLDQDPGAAFTLGLLHDVGRLALAQGQPDLFRALRAYESECDCSPAEAEQALLGLDHAAIGAKVAECWNFSAGIVEAIARHHQPGEARHSVETDLLHLADQLAHALDLAQQPQEMVPPLSMACWLRLDIDEADLNALAEKVSAQHGALCRALFDEGSA